MKKLASYLIILFITSCELFAQKKISIDSTKYRIHLPDYWGSGNKVWRILTDKLPTVCDDLRDKELCGDDCNPWLHVEFVISDFAILDYIPNMVSANYSYDRSKPSENWDIQTLYSFSCSLLLMDNHDKIITRFIIIDTTQVWRLISRVKLASYAPAAAPVTYRKYSSTRIGVVTDPTTFVNTSQQYVPSAQEGETPFSYISNNKEKLMPELRDLFRIIDQKINSW
jgi:hypothetical protein